MSYGLKVI